MGLIQGLGHSSERQEPIDFGEYMAEHLKVFEEVSECLRALGFEKTSLCDEPLLVLRERGREGGTEGGRGSSLVFSVALAVSLVRTELSMVCRPELSGSAQPHKNK